MSFIDSQATRIFVGPEQLNTALAVSKELGTIKWAHATWKSSSYSKHCREVIVTGAAQKGATGLDDFLGNTLAVPKRVRARECLLPHHVCALPCSVRI